jgi:signal transduction histidine kinase/ligand-binding sensor domain-containing protein
MVTSRLFLAALLMWWSSPARASSAALADYTITTWSENDGLPAGRVRAIDQDEDGYLWLATDGGLYRFDGVRFEPWGAPGARRLPAGIVTALTTARDHTIWVGINSDRPVGRIRNGQLTLYGARDGFYGSYVLSLLEDHDGAVWAGTFQGLFRFRDGRWQQVGQFEGLPYGSVLAVYEDRARRLWVATAGAVFRRATENDRFEQVDEIDISSNVWQAFSEDANGTLWISDFRNGFRQVGHRPLRVGERLRRGWGVQLLHDRRRNLWVATQGQGLWRVSGDPSAANQRIDVITADEGLASDAVHSLLEDREGNIWIGTNVGLQRLSPHRVTPVKSLPIARAVASTADGSVWVGTAAGLARFSATGRRDYTERDGLPGSVVLALHADEGETLWIATERGLARFTSGRFSPILVPATDRVQRIFSIASSGDTLWVRDLHSRLFRWRNGVLTVADDIPDLYRSTSRVVYGDREGRVWIGASGGRLGVRDTTGHFRAFELAIGAIGCIFEDSTGTLWFGGQDGIGQLAEGGPITVTRVNGFPGNARAIVEDAAGAMWIAVGSGIMQLERSEIIRAATAPEHQLRYRLFTTADGLAGVPVGDGSLTGLRSRDDKLWFATSSGVTIVDPLTVGDPRVTPPARIETVAADRRTFDPVSKLRLPARTSHLQIAFTALTLADARRVRFRYRLDGFDRDWVDAGTTRQASYTNLAPGEYRFLVSARNSEGTWTDPPTQWQFAIDPMFYQTRWFYALCAVVLLMLVCGAWRLRVRQVRGQFALVLAERIRMSRAIHDTLLQGLAALALQIDDLSHNLDAPSATLRARVLRIRKRIEEDVREARQSIWDLRSPRLETRGLLEALRETGERAVADHPVQFDFTVNGTPQPSAPPVQEHILLICQEALNNAVHHGRANRVSVEVDYTADRLRLRVTDDGCGFDPEAVRSSGGHYGLISMHERAQQLRGRITIASRPGRGTEVETVVPVA